MTSSGSSRLRPTSRLIDARVKDYTDAIHSCPPVSKALIAHLDRMFSRKTVLPTSPSMQQELVFQAGIEKIKDYLKEQNARQERETSELQTTRG